MTTPKYNPFPAAAQILGFRLSHGQSALTKQTERNDLMAVEFIEVWSGDVIQVRHVLPHHSHPALRWEHGHAYFQRPAQGEVWRERTGALQPIATEEAEISLCTDALIHVHHGAHTLLIRQVPAATSFAGRGSEERDWPFLGALLTFAALAAMFALIVISAQAEFKLENIEIKDRFAHVLLLQPQKPKPKRAVVRKKKKVESITSAPGSSAGPPKPAGTRNKITTLKLRNKETVQHAGLIAALNNGNDLGSTHIDNTLIAGIGSPPGNSGAGTSPFGGRQANFGSGPGVEGWTGGHGTIGGGGSMSGTELCKGGGENCLKKKRLPVRLQLENSIQIGSLSKAEVDEVIRRHLPQIRYCYQKEVQQNHLLYGKVVTHFTISKSGSVSTAKVSRSTLSEAAVGDCIVRTMFRMNFPKPKGGGHVLVTYPFTFQAV
jgi:outer membrane biosynthesis protein TonB